MKNLLIAVTLLLLSSQVQPAEPPSWLYPTLKVDNPNELAVYVLADSKCPITTDELKEIVSGVLIRSRGKPLLGDEWLERSLFLEATVNCMKLDTPESSQIFNIGVQFGNYSVTPPVQYPTGYKYVGIGSKDYIVSTYKSKVEAAMTDYIAANFDL